MASRRAGGRTLAAGIVILGVASAAWVPAAAADPCQVTVTVLGGEQLVFDVNVPPGTPLSSISLPVKLPVVSMSESCQTAQASSGPTTTTTSATIQPTPSKHAAAPHRAGRPRPEPRSHRRGTPSQSHSRVSPRRSRHGAQGTAGAPRTGTTGSSGQTGSAPSAENPTYTLALPGPAGIGVPNFFIDNFQIPPFLLPIYQAAGIEYDVPWQVLAAINEVETDYGRNLSVSSAGAVGWMQFLPSTWKRWGVDANGDGVADPYNPVDAIFSAARYLQAAGAAKNVGRAIFAYNHASWYVQSVLLRAKLIGGMPNQLIGALSELVQGHFPVAARARYVDRGRSGTPIYAKPGSPVIAVDDGRVLRVGKNAQLGRYVVLQDETGNTYTYAGLGSVPSTYPVPKPVRVTAVQLRSEIDTAIAHAGGPTEPATAGTQPVAAPAHAAATQTATRTPAPAAATKRPAPSANQTAPGGVLKERLFAYPRRPASYAAGGAQQVHRTEAPQSEFQNYFSDVLRLPRNQYTIKPLRRGSIVVAGTVLGRTAGSHMTFKVQPAGTRAPYIDPKPVLDGWKLLEATAVYRADGIDPFYGPGAKNPTIGQVLLMSKSQLQVRTLEDPHAHLDACLRRQVLAGQLDRQLLASIEYLTASGLDPSASCARSGGINIIGVNGLPIQAHDTPGSITDLTTRRLRTLQGADAPTGITSLPGRLLISFSTVGRNMLGPGQWVQLIHRISQIPEPNVPIAPSPDAVKVGRSKR
jgi:hypothetical protein